MEAIALELEALAAALRIKVEGATGERRRRLERALR